MDKELTKQRIRSLIEDGGYADLMEVKQDIQWWKWLAVLATITLIAHLTIDILRRGTDLF